jgi:hypothetical protein
MKTQTPEANFFIQITQINGKTRLILQFPTSIVRAYCYPVLLSLATATGLWLGQAQLQPSPQPHTPTIEQSRG